MSFSDFNTCSHGQTYGESHLGSSGWSGGVGTCTCCKATYGYVDSSTWGDAGDGRFERIASRSYPRSLCLKCGGEAIDYLHPDYERVELPNGVRHLRRRVDK